jgi:hypothetical protein
VTFSNLAYIPLDIPPIDFSVLELNQLFANHSSSHHPYPHIWDALCVGGRVNSWNDPIDHYRAWNERYILEGDVLFNPNLSEKLKNDIEVMLNYLPYKKYTFAQILCQKINVAAHQDGFYNPTENLKDAVYRGPSGFNNEPEPAGLKVMLTHKGARCFYLSEKAGSPRNFIRLPSDTNCFAINERTFFHGAKYLGEPKYILSTFGIIDPDKHKEIIERSLKKYADYAIRF